MSHAAGVLMPVTGPLAELTRWEASMNTHPATVGRLEGQGHCRSAGAQVAPVAQHQPFRVLQTGRAPAQLSLFLRPGMTSR